MPKVLETAGHSSLQRRPPSQAEGMYQLQQRYQEPRATRLRVGVMTAAGHELATAEHSQRTTALQRRMDVCQLRAGEAQVIYQAGRSGGHNFDRQETQQALPSYLDRPHSDVVTGLQLLNGQGMLATDDPHPRRNP